FARGFLLFLYLFLVIASYVVGKAARDALFLDKFSASQLPYADMGVALLVGVVIALYIRIGRAVTLRHLLVGSLIFFAICTLLFWRLRGYCERSVLTPAT